jgi:SAM-dependent methyltransferase
MPFGSEIALTPGLSPFERLYIRMLGAPILGLRMRTRAILPLFREIGSPRRIADAGCGRGTITFAFARTFPEAEVIGIDLDEKQNAIDEQVATQLGISNVRFCALDVLRIEELGLFDAILSSDNLEHLEDDVECAKTFLRALNVHVPHLTRNLFGWHRTNWMSIEGHVRPGYTRESLTDLLTRAGFSSVWVAYDYNSIQTLANDLSFLITAGRQHNKTLYAICFPFLLALAEVGALYRPHNDGTSLIALARK